MNSKFRIIKTNPAKQLFYCLRTSLLIVLLVSFSHKLSASPQIFQNADSLENREVKPLKILSWNIYMLPRFALRTGKNRRVKRIIEVLSKENYDIIVFQEAFHKGARGRIKNGLKHLYPHRFGPANRKRFSLKANSGIWIVSKIPLRELGEIDFEQCEGIDCWSRKGALMVEGEWQGHPFQIVGTHLEAGGKHSIRHSQYLEISEGLLKPFAKKDVPQFICGDMNTHSTEPEKYGDMLKCLDAKNGELSGERRSSCKDGGIIDYILTRANGNPPTSIKKEIKVFEKEWQKEPKILQHIMSPTLSDHYAVEAIIEF